MTRRRAARPANGRGRTRSRPGASAQEELNVVQRILATILGNLPITAYQCRNDRRFTLIMGSEGRANLLARTPEEIEQFQMAWDDEPVHPDDEDRVWQEVQQAVREGRPYQIVYRYFTNSGEMRWLLDHGHAIRVPGEPEPILEGCQIDVTDYRRIEQALEQARDRLHQTHKLEAIGRLAGGIAHDFNNLLTVINGPSKLLLNDMRPGEPMHQGLEEICAAGRRAAALTGQLLAFSRRQPVQNMLVDIGRLTSEICRLLQRLIGGRIVLEIDAREDLGRIRGDASQFEQVIMNLVLNARDAIEGEGRIEVLASNIDLDEESGHSSEPGRRGRFVLFQVRDNGRGMKGAERERAFEPFYTTKEPGHGTGLGLSVVYGVAQQCKGWVEIDSEEGRGTTVSVYFPRDESAETQAADRPPALHEDSR